MVWLKIIIGAGLLVLVLDVLFALMLAICSTVQYVRIRRKIKQNERCLQSDGR